MPRTLACIFCALLLLWPAFASADSAPNAQGVAAIMGHLTGNHSRPIMSVRPNHKLAVDCAAEREQCSDSVPCCPEAPNCTCVAIGCFCR